MERSDGVLLGQYKSSRKKYLELEKLISQILDDIIKKNDFFVMDVAHRTKEVDSLQEKLERKGGKYASLMDIKDLCGFRIICYFSDTVDKIAKALEEVFIFDRENTIDKRATLQSTQFGYLSLHCICSLPEKDIYPEEMWGVPFEIQIRTVLQHAWAEIEHDLGYKSDFGVPKAIRRNFSRVASLLEVADREFLAIREDSEEYTRQIKERINSSRGNNVLIDRVSLTEYMRNNVEIIRFINEVTDEIGVEVEFIDPGTFVKQLEWLGVETIGDLTVLFKNNQQYVYDMIKKTAEDFGIDIISTAAILRFTCEGELIRGKFKEPMIRRYLSVSYSDPVKIERNLNRILGRED